MKAIIIIAIIILGLSVVLMVKRDYKKTEELNQKIEKEKEDLKPIVFKLINKENLKEQLSNLVSYEFFKENCILDLEDQIEDEISIEKNYMHKFECISSLPTDRLIDVIIDILESSECNDLFAHLYIEQINENIDTVYKIEKENEIYNNSFGKESEGDPELHPKNPSSEYIDDTDIEEKNLRELSSIGTVEDIDE